MNGVSCAGKLWRGGAVFREWIEINQIAALEDAVALYRGQFLEGFSLKDSLAFEDWSLLVREQLQRRFLTMLHRLARAYEQAGQIKRACEYAWRQVELEPWQEERHQQLMRLLALSDQRSAALAQYETCRRLLQEELGAPPAAETIHLYERIRDNKLGGDTARNPGPTTFRPRWRL